MSSPTLIIGSKRYSSWSLRAWLFLRHHGIVFREVVVPLYADHSSEALRELSPSGKVPVLDIDGYQVWESLAICEYLAERLRLPQAWPDELQARAYARSVACEMHAGFAELRREWPFDAQREPAVREAGVDATTDIQRVCTIWREARSLFGAGGPWLFGSFGIADAMFAPVALRMHFYGATLDPVSAAYVATVLADPAVREWLQDARGES